MAKTENQVIYFDHSATTPLDGDVLKAMLPYFSESYGNANSAHTLGRKAFTAVDASRRKVAELLGVKPGEIYFTSGGTEADNWALKGVVRTKERPRVVVSAIEHAAVLSTAKEMQKAGADIAFVPVTSKGTVTPEALEKTIDGHTALVSVMLANNEIGTIQPIKELAQTAHAHGAYFHTDAVQAVGSIPVNPVGSGADMLSLSAHKFYGPKGIGVLYVRSGVKLSRLISGGDQERGMRGGSTNVPLVVGLVAAMEKAVLNQAANAAKIKKLRDYFIREVIKNIPYVTLNGDAENRLPQNANFTFHFIEGESVLLNLDLKGIACSSGSACASESLEPSHVLLAAGVPAEQAHGSIRFSFGVRNTQKEVDFTVKELAGIVARLRSISPLWPALPQGEQNCITTR